MELKQQYVICKNYSQLAELLDTDDDLVDEMKLRRCLTPEVLEKLTTDDFMCDRNKKLLDVVRRRSIGSFNLFVECVRSVQPHVVPLLTGKEGNTYAITNDVNTFCGG